MRQGFGGIFNDELGDRMHYEAYRQSYRWINFLPLSNCADRNIVMPINNRYKKATTEVH